MFNVASDGSFFFVPSFVWRSKGPRNFRSYKDPLKPMSVHYFSSKNLRWTQASWKVFYRDLKVKCA